MGDEPDFTKRRLVLVEMTLPKRNWSSSEVQEALQLGVPLLQPTVMGEVDRGAIKECRRKLRQAAAECESGKDRGGIQHSIWKAIGALDEAIPTPAEPKASE